MPLTISKVFKLHRAQALVVISTLALCGALLAYFIQLEKNQTLDSEQDRLQMQARAIDANIVQQLAGINAALLSRRLDAPVSGRNASLNRERSGELRVLEGAMPAVRMMQVLDPQGKVQSASHAASVGFDASRRAYFLTAKTQHNSQTLYVSAPFITTLNVYGVNMVRAWTDSGNRLLGVTTATLDPEHFKVLLKSVLYAEDMQATLVHADGLAFLTVPGNQSIQGSNLKRPGTFFSQHLASGKVESFFNAHVAQTDERRLVAYRTVSPSNLQMDRPLMVAVSRELDAVLAPWRHLAWVLGATYAGVCALTLAGLYIFGRKEKLLEQVTKAHAQETWEQSERLELALAAGDLGLIDLDLKSGTRLVNARAQSMVGNSPDDPVDTSDEWSARQHPDDQLAVQAARLAHEAGETELMDLEYRIRHKDGHWVWLHIRGRVTLRDADGTPLRLVGIYQEITERKAAEGVITELAFNDPLTRLPNRRLLMERLRQAQVSSARSGQLAALLFMDLDRFKWVNDNLGHDKGDLLLQQVAQRLQSCVRTSDTVARLGGDEFVLVLVEVGDSLATARNHAERTAQNILIAMREPIQLGKHTHVLTCSIGITVFAGEAQTPSQLLKQADQALYAAKGAGRNQTAIYHESEELGL